MADYHIYIHGDGNGTLNDKFVPEATKQEGGESTPSNVFESAVKKGVGFVKSGGNVISPVAEKVGQAFPIVALIIAAVKVTDHLIATGTELVGEYYGRYEFAIGYNNIKVGLSTLTNPLSIPTTIAKRQLEIRKNNIRIEEENKLIGNSTFKNITKGM